MSFMAKLGFLCLALSCCFRPVADSVPDAACSEKTIAFPIEPWEDGWYAGEFFPIDGGIIFGSALASINPETGEHWRARPDRDFMGFGFLPTWFHPDGLRSLLVASIAGPPGIWRLDLDANFTSYRSTLLVPLSPSHMGVSASRVSARRIDVCVGELFVGNARLFTFEDSTVVERAMPVGVRRCVDAMEWSDGTLFLVVGEDGGQGSVRVSPTSVELTSSEPRGSCRFASRTDAGPTLWCAEGRRLTQADAFDGSVVFAHTTENDIDWITAVAGVDQAVVIREVDSRKRFTLMDVAGRRRDIELDGFSEPMFARLSDGRVILGGMMSDGGFESKRFCW